MLDTLFVLSQADSAQTVCRSLPNKLFFKQKTKISLLGYVWYTVCAESAVDSVTHSLSSQVARLKAAKARPLPHLAFSYSQLTWTLTVYLIRHITWKTWHSWNCLHVLTKLRPMDSCLSDPINEKLKATNFSSDQHTSIGYDGTLGPQFYTFSVFHHLRMVETRPNWSTKRSTNSADHTLYGKAVILETPLKLM